MSPFVKRISFSSARQIGLGDAANTVFYMQKGRVKVVVLSEHGKEAVVGILEPGQFFGEGCLNGQPLRISTTTALEDCVITAIAKTAIYEIAVYEFKIGR
jgi:CRP/FNR family transcriptional regulator, cyclic AMP receptor protein